MLVRPLSAVAWELRTAWATGRRVALSLERCDVDRLEGTVQRVAATGATVKVAGLVVPLDRVLAVHWPSRLGDSTQRGESADPARPRALARYDGQQELTGW
jgi:hypothetical protein